MFYCGQPALSDMIAGHYLVVRVDTVDTISGHLRRALRHDLDR